MNRVLVANKLERIAAMYIDGLDDRGSDLMAEPMYLKAYNMAALFLDIEKEFSIDLNELVPRLNLFSQEEIASEVFRIVSEHEK